MNQHLRQQHIVELVKSRGYISIDDLAQHFSVTPQTVRRDLNQLADAGMIRRYHGGGGSRLDCAKYGLCCKDWSAK